MDATAQTAQAPTAEAARHHKARKTAITAYNAEMVRFEDARGKGNKKAMFSATGKAANRSREIRDAELELATLELDGDETAAYTPWEKPGNHAQKTRQTPMSKDEIVGKIAKLQKLHDTTPMETVKVSSGQRIEALKKAAEKRGYTL